MSVKFYRNVLIQLVVVLVASVSLISSSNDTDVVSTQTIPVDDNKIESHQHMACGSIATNITSVVLKNPQYPEPTYTKSICETVIERTDPSITKLTVKFKRLELYRSTIDGQCLHDRFAVYTDLNAPVTPVVCGNQTGKTISVPFFLPLTSLVVSITTSDLDHDRTWEVEIEQATDQIN